MRLRIEWTNCDGQRKIMKFNVDSAKAIERKEAEAVYLEWEDGDRVTKTIYPNESYPTLEITLGSQILFSR